LDNRWSARIRLAPDLGRVASTAISHRLALKSTDKIENISYILNDMINRFDPRLKAIRA